jgi:hypothetical protein
VVRNADAKANVHIVLDVEDSFQYPDVKGISCRSAPPIRARWRRPVV